MKGKISCRDVDAVINWFIISINCSVTFSAMLALEFAVPSAVIAVAMVAHFMFWANIFFSCTEPN